MKAAVRTNHYTRITLIIIFLIMTILLLLSGLSAYSVSKAAAFCMLMLLVFSLISGKFKDMPKTVVTPIVISTAAYLVIYTVSLFYATTGQFALTVFSYYLGGISIFLLTILFVNKDSVNTRSLLLILSSAVGIGGIVSIDAASVRGLTTALESVLSPLLINGDYFGGYESGTRMISIVNNPNVFGSLAALATLAAAYLFLSAQSKKEKNISIGLLIINSVSMLYCFSLGSLFSMFCGMIGFIVLSGREERLRVVYLILATIFASFLSIFAGFSGMGKSENLLLSFLPLISLAFFGFVLAFMLHQMDRFIFWAGNLDRKKILIFSLLVLLFLGGTFGAAFSISDSYTFDASGNTMRRAVTLVPGDYQLEIGFGGAGASTSLVIESQSYEQASTHTSSTLYSGEINAPVSFTVPIESSICFFNITAPDGTVIDNISVLDSENQLVKAIKPDYLLLPTFITNRLQGLFVNENAAQRFVFFKDGLKIAAMSPIIGHGPGAFESKILSVQDYYYTTNGAHNHYIQTLDETGVVGLIAFLSIFVFSAIALIKKVRTAGNRPLYSSLSAMLLVLIVHTAIEVTFTFGIYNLAAFMIFGLISANYGQREEVVIYKKKVTASVPKTAINVTLCLCIVISVLYIGHFTAYKTVTKAAAAGDMVKFMDTLSFATKLDFTNNVNYKVSYLAAYSPELPEAYYKKAQSYAEDLERHNSFATLTGLVNYYSLTAQTEKAYQTLNNRQALMRYDAAAWNATFDFYRASMENAVNAGSGDSDINMIKKYASAAYQQLKAYLETSPLDIQLSDENREFLEEINISS